MRLKIHLFFLAMVILSVTSMAGSISTDFNALPSGAALYGNAYLSGGMAYLTSNGGSQLGGLSFAELDPGLAVSSFNAEFDLQLGGGSGADGLSFSFTTLGNVGAVGEWGTTSGIAIEFDTYNNSEVNDNHMTLYYNGSARVTNGSLPVNLNNNAVHHARVAMNNGTINVYLTPSGGSESHIFSHTISGWSAYRGQFLFGGRTGGATDYHRVDNFVASTTPMYAINVSSNINFGNVRVGTSSSSNLTVTNTGGGTLTGTFGAASGDFDPETVSSSFNLTQSQQSVRTYTFSPTTTGVLSSNVTVSSNGGNVTRTLSGTGVSPVFQSSIAPGTTLDFGIIDKSQSATRTLTIQNLASSNLGDLTNLTILSATITGEDASYFTLEENFTPIVISKDGTISLAIRATNYDDAFHDRNAVLTLVTDQNAALGMEGNIYTFNLNAYMLPEPSTYMFMGIASILFFLYRFYSKRY